MEVSFSKGKYPPIWLRIVVLVGLFVSIGIVIFFGNQLHRELEQLAIQQFNQQQLILARSAATSIEDFVQNLEDKLRLLAMQPAVQKITPDCLKLMQKVFPTFPEETLLKRLDRDGVVRYVCPSTGWRKKLIGRNNSTQSYFQKAKMTGQAAVSRVTIDERGKKTIYLAVPVYYQNNRGVQEFNGVIVASFDLKKLNKLYVAPFVTGKTGYAWMLAEDSIFVAHREEEFIGRNAFKIRRQKDPNLSYEKINHIQHLMITGKEGTGRYMTGWSRERKGKIEKLIAYTPLHVGNRTWSMAVCTPIDEVEHILRVARRRELLSLGGIVLILISGGAFFLFIAYRWTSTLEHEVARQTAQMKGESEYQLQLEKCLTKISANLLRFENIDKIINTTLQLLCKTLGTSCAYLFEISDDGNTIDNTHFCVKGKTVSPVKNLHRLKVENFPYWMKKLTNNEVIDIADIENIPRFAYAEKNFFQQQGIHSILAVPIHVSGKLYGFMSFTEMERKRSWKPMEIVALRTVAGSVSRVIERMQAEEALRKSKAKYMDLYENANDIIFTFDLEGRFTSANRAAYTALGYEKEEVCEKSLSDIFSPETCSFALEMLQKAVELRSDLLEFQPWEFEAIKKDGSKLIVEVRTRLLWENDQIVGVQGIARDITARKKAEERLKKLNECFLKLGTDSLKNIETIVYTAGEILGGACMLYNRLESDRGLLCTWAIWHRPEGYNPEDKPEGHICYDVIVEGGEKPILIENFAGTKYEKTDPNVVKYNLKSYLGIPVKLGGKVVGSFCLCDIKERKFTKDEIEIASMLGKAISIEEERLKAAAALKESQERYSSLVNDAIDSLSSGIIILDKDFKIVWMNKAIEEFWGIEREHFIGSDKRKIVTEKIKYIFENPDHFESIVFKTYEDETCFESFQCHVLPEGTRRERFLIYRSVPINTGALKGGRVVHYYDITEQKQLEAQLHQAQKMEAIGTLAGGIAHDFNNILTGIMGYVQLALMDFSPQHPLYDDLKCIEREADRGATLVRQLMAFSRRQVLQIQRLDLNSIVQDLTKLMRRIVHENIFLRTVLAEDLAAVKADRTALEQILMNLCSNARDAMPEGGELLIETQNVTLDDGYCKTHPGAKAGKYVMLAVSDTGVGIGKEIQDHLFEPFFTTKEVGKGTGLGLAMVYGLVKQQEGLIYVYSEPKKGSTFKIYLPAASAETEAVEIEKEEEEEELSLLGGTETILVVEDEGTVRSLIVRILQEQGYTIMTAADGKEALRLLEEKNEEIDLVISDVVMPNMSGRQLYESILNHYPATRVLFISGYSINSVNQKFILEHKLPYMNKPFSLPQLLRKVREILDEKA